jgi:hypothetical protein
MDEIERETIHNKFRNPVLSYFTGERLLILYSPEGISGVIVEVQKPRQSQIMLFGGSVLCGKGGAFPCLLPRNKLIRMRDEFRIRTGAQLIKIHALTFSFYRNSKW